MFNKVSSLGLLLFSSMPLYAHDYWLQPVEEGYVLHRGHLHSDHAGQAELPFSPQQVTGVWCLQGGRVMSVNAVSQTYPVRIRANCDALRVDVDSGVWTQSITGIENKPSSEVFAPLKSWHAYESVKYVQHWQPALTQPLYKKGLELVFRKDFTHLQPGDKVRLTALLNGKPVSNVLVAYDGHTRGETDESGQINIRIRHGGAQTISASFKDYQHIPAGLKYTLYATTLLFPVERD